MMYRRHKPAPPLARFVDAIWHYECDEISSQRERILPSGAMGIVINLREDNFHVENTTFPGAIFSGAYSEYFTLDTAQQAHTLGIQFKPGGAFPFLRMPASKLEGQHVPLQDLWGSRAGEMHQRVLATKNIDQRFRIVEEVLLACLKPMRDPHPVVAYALREIGNAGSIAGITSQIGLSPRRFTDVFRDEVGLTPKLFHRLRRFQRALRRISQGGQIDWADCALSAGYYDQPHFIHDFQAFSGLNPSSYKPRTSEYVNHVPIPD